VMRRARRVHGFVRPVLHAVLDDVRVEHAESHGRLSV
jgi:hypothetical protein